MLDNIYQYPPGYEPPKYGMDISDEIESLLAEEISKSIDMEIMKRIMQEHRNEKIRKILEKIK